MQFPTAKKKRFDIVGVFLSAFITLAITAVFIYLISAVADGYAAVKINKLNDPYARSLELLNVIYLFAIGAVALLALEKARKSLTRKEDRYVYLRLPVKPRTIFISKFAALLLWTFSCAALIIIPVNVIFYIVLSPPPIYWIYTLFILILLPLVSFSAATLLLIPYIAVMNFIKDKYALIFIILTAIIIGAFAVYSKILGTVQSLVETGSVKFLFNARFVETLQKILKISYPANALASLALGQRVARSLLLSLLFVAIGIAFSMAIDTALYHITLYKNEGRAKIGRRRRTYTKHGVFASLLHKEFISVFREPKHLFSYFAIAAAMPFMVYTCFTLFETLIYNALGLTLAFPLALITVLIFGVLTNTFCATNVSRDGLGALKSKVFPVKPAKILLAKVVFCSIVSSVSIFFSSFTLALNTGLDRTEGIRCIIIAVAFSLAQIFIATRIDLNNAHPGATPDEMEKVTSRTVTKAVTVGLIFAVSVGLISMLITVYTKGGPIEVLGIALNESHADLIPLLASIAYLAASVLFYSVRIGKSFLKLTK
jgi:ABC-2 type transport system permease protein